MNVAVVGVGEVRGWAEPVVDTVAVGTVPVATLVLAAWGVDAVDAVDDVPVWVCVVVAGVEDVVAGVVVEPAEVDVGAVALVDTGVDVATAGVDVVTAGVDVAKVGVELATVGVVVATVGVVTRFVVTDGVDTAGVISGETVTVEMPATGRETANAIS